MAAAKLKFHPSGSKRWINCPGSVRLSAEQKPSDTKWSLGGKAAHHLAEDALNQVLKLKDGETTTPLCMMKLKPEFEDHHDPNMDHAVQKYVDFIIGKAQDFGADLYVERKFKMKASGSIISGIADAVVISDVFGFLGVYDYKHGEGTVVDVERNSQLMIGALAIIKELNWHPDEIEVGIIQPRTYEGDGIKLWKTNAEELYMFEQEVIIPAIKNAKLKKPTLSTGEHCRFCQVEKCPKVIEEAKDLAILQYEKTPYDLSYQELYKVLHFIENVLPPWTEKIKELALKKALDGQAIPGYKVVGSITRASWTPGSKDELVELVGDKVLKHSLMTPKQVMDMIEDDETKETVSEMILKSDQFPRLAQDTDRRKPWVESTAFDEFADFFTK